MARFVQKGEALDHTPGSALAAGAIVVLGTVGVGIAQTAIAANTVGSLIVDGVIEHPKTAAQAVTLGQKIYFDAANNLLTTTVGSNVLVGYAVRAQAAADATVTVKLMKV
jgi:predicted RecA/RadA family phage recombinase